MIVGDQFVGFVLAVLAGVALVGLPGLALGRLFDWPSADAPSGDRPRGLGAGFLLGFAALPALDAVLARLASLDVALVVNIGLAAWVAGLWLRAGRPIPRPEPLVVALLGVWIALVAVDSLDLVIGGGLYRPLTTFDMIKHAAITQGLVDKGAPPPDPFFLRPERASYYYFFYVLSALVERVGGGLIDARAAVTGLMVWVGVALYTLFRFVIIRAGGVAAPRWLLLLVLGTGGVDAVMALYFGVVGHRWLPQPDDWNEQITGWFQSVLWVPHHLSALMAAIVGMATLTAPPGLARWRRVGLCALCFAATFGLSVWVFLGLAATLAIWFAIQLARRQWREGGTLVMAGALALLLALPQLFDLIHGRAPGGYAQIVASVRFFTLVEGFAPEGPLRQLVRALALPVNYLAVFGALMSGSIWYWRVRAPDRRFDNDFDRILALSGGVGLFIGSFFKSTTINNDLGWRIMLFPLLTGSVWTFRVLAAHRKRGAGPARPTVAWPPLIVGLIVLGVFTNVYAVFGLRLAPWFPRAPDAPSPAARAKLENDLRAAYQWANRTMPGVVSQHNPLHQGEAGLYGGNRVAVEDFYGAIFGAKADAVQNRIEALAAAFCDVLPDARLAALARQEGVGAYVVTARDPVWARPDSFVWRTKPLFAAPTVRIMSAAPVSVAAADAGVDAAASWRAYPFPPEACGAPRT